MLALEMKELSELDFDLDILGFSEEELNELDIFGEPDPEPQTEEDEIPELPTEAITKPGDIWILGNHRLLCGDTTLIDDVQKLMQNDVADMIFTDPPYNVNYGSTMKDSIRYHAGSLGGRKIMNDNLGDGFAQFLTDALSNLMMYCQGAAYVCMSSSELHTLYNSFINAGGKWSTFIIWAKNTFTLGRADYQRQYEPILYGWRADNKHYWCGDRNQSDVWEYNKPVKNDLHPTMKPVELVERAINNSSKPGDVVLDGFGGSGSTLIAAEKAGRKARLIELGSSAIMGGINLLKAGVGYLQVTLAGLSVSAKSAVAGITMMNNVSKLAAAQMAITATAAGVLKGALALIGGPAGLAVLAGMAIYKLVDSHNVAKKAAKDHAETLKKLQDELKATAQEATKFSAEQTKDMALAEWGLKLKTAEQNIKDLRKELKNTGGLSFLTRFTPNALLEDYEVYAKDWANVLRQSKIDLERYEEEIWKLAAEYPDFQPQAQEIQNKLLLLKAAEQDAIKAREELKYLRNPELRPKVEVEEKTNVQATVTPKTDIKADTYKKTPLHRPDKQKDQKAHASWSLTIFWHSFARKQQHKHHLESLVGGNALCKIKAILEPNLEHLRDY